MADAAVEFLLDNLRQLLEQHYHLIKDVHDQVKQLERDLSLFREFLINDSAKRRRREGRLTLVREIRDVVYDAEDVIDAFVTQAAEIQSKNKFSRAFKTPVSLHNISSKVNEVVAKVRNIYQDQARIDFAEQNVGDGEPEESELHHSRKDKKVVGFEDEAAKIIGFLNEKTDKLDVISVIGMPGLGKTTLAGKIFHDKGIEYEFPTRIWVYVSQDFSKKAVYLAILRDLTRITDDINQKTDEQLAQMVYSRLERGKFLIVMDDVWTPADWDKILAALPVSNKDCKVLITSRNDLVGRQANRRRPPHHLRFLREDESWELLQYEVFGAPICPPHLEHLEPHGIIIANKCGGLPLAIVIIGGILVNKMSDDMVASKAAWTKVSKSVDTYLTEEDPERRMENIIALSYDKLPYHLRACFLYFGMFPKDSGIPVRRLISMWIAEGFIQQKDGISLEETAENYLDDLINRNLVRVNKRRHDGGVKTCDIHDVLRDFCKREAGSDRENFFQEMKKTEGRFEHTDVQKFRRLCIHSNVLDFISLNPNGPRVRSFICVSPEEIDLPLLNTGAIPAAFKLLRVLDVKPIKFLRISSEMYRLVHLRHIVLTFDTTVLPATFSKFWNLQTLIIETPSRSINIKADVWKLTQLRNLKTNASATLPRPGTGGKEGGKLQTLGMIAPESCTEEVFSRAQNLRTLGIRGQLSELLEGKVGSFVSLKKLKRFEKLKLVNDPFHGTPSDNRLSGLPPHDQFPLKLKSLTLSKTFLDWSDMSILGSLGNLEVLKVKDKAFVGNYWEVNDGGFRKLKVLHIGHTDLVYWKASHDHFPKLITLELHNCEGLLQIPIGLAEVPDFMVLDLYRSTGAANSANKIYDAKQKKWEEQGIKDREFKLVIFPPS